MACGSPSSTTPTVAPFFEERPIQTGPVVRVGEPLDAVEADAGSAGGSASPPATLQLRFEGVSRLHQGYFSSPGPLRLLAEGLAGCVGDVDVEVAYDTPARRGTITLDLAPGQLLCKPTLSESGVNLSPLEPLGRALAAYRDAVAASYDYRVATFEAWVSARGQDAFCSVKLAGQYPPDGSTWSPCVEVDPEAPRCTSRENRGVDVLPLEGPGAFDQGMSCWGG